MKSRDGRGGNFENRPAAAICLPAWSTGGPQAGRSRIPFPPRPAFWTSWTTPICASMWRRQRGRRPAGSACSICLRLESGMGTDISMWMSCGWLPPSAAGDWPGSCLPRRERWPGNGTLPASACTSTRKTPPPKASMHRRALYPAGPPALWKSRCDGLLRSPNPLLNAPSPAGRRGGRAPESKKLPA